MAFAPTYLIDESCDGFQWFMSEAEHWEALTLYYIQEKFKAAFTDDMLLAKGFGTRKIQDKVAELCEPEQGSTWIAEILKLKTDGPADAAYADWVLRSVLSIGDSVFKMAKRIKQEERIRSERRAAQRPRAPLAAYQPPPRYQVVPHLGPSTALGHCQPNPAAGTSGPISTRPAQQVTQQALSTSELSPALSSNTQVTSSTQASADPELPTLPQNAPANALSIVELTSSTSDKLPSSEFNDSDYEREKAKNADLTAKLVALKAQRRKEGKQLRRENRVLATIVDEMEKSLVSDSK